MKILVFGAGIIGSVYAARLFEVGHEITLLARGKRYDSLKTNGIKLKNINSGKETIHHIPLIKTMGNIKWDLVIVAVRFDQFNETLVELKSYTSYTTIMFMMNNPRASAHLSDEFINKQIVLAFPGIGGVYTNTQIEYIQIQQQKTTVGKISGSSSSIITEIKKILESAGFEVAVCKNMQAWLKVHAVFITCISAAIDKEKGNSIQLAKNRMQVKLMVKSIKEGFDACKSLGLPILPANLNILFMYMPEWFAVFYWQKALKGVTGTLAIAPHADAAKKEIQMLAILVQDIVRSSNVPASKSESLLQSYIKS